MVEKTLRVLTANLYNGGASLGSLRKVLDREHPDVAAFQELDPAQARIVEQEMPYGHLDPRRDHQGMGIAARQPITVERFEMPYRSGLKAILKEQVWPELSRDIELINVHVQNPIMRPLRQTSRNRRGQVEAILEYTSAKRMSRILLGDLNSTPRWKAYKRLAEQLQDAAVAAGTAAPTWGQFSWMPRILRIDHAFVEGLVPLSTHVARIRGSDHSAVVVDLYVE